MTGLTIRGEQRLSHSPELDMTREAPAWIVLKGARLLLHGLLHGCYTRPKPRSQPVGDSYSKFGSP
jgi:hypothetical protein